MSDANALPVIGTVIGDPCGIGPEVVAEVRATGEVHRYSRPLLIGSSEVIRRVAEGVSSRLKARPFESGR